MYRCQFKLNLTVTVVLNYFFVFYCSYNNNNLFMPEADGVLILEHTFLVADLTVPKRPEKDVRLMPLLL